VTFTNNHFKNIPKLVFLVLNRRPHFFDFEFNTDTSDNYRQHWNLYILLHDVFSDRPKAAAVYDGLCKFMGSEFQNIGPATEKAWRPYVVSRWEVSPADGWQRWWIPCRSTGKLL